MLAYLSVNPEYRGQGIGTRLVQAGQSEIDRLGLDTFVMARTAALNVYIRCGFTLLDEVHQDATYCGGEKDFAVYALERVLSR